MGHGHVKFSARGVFDAACDNNSPDALNGRGVRLCVLKDDSFYLNSRATGGGRPGPSQGSAELKCTRTLISKMRENKRYSTVSKIQIQCKTKRTSR